MKCPVCHKGKCLTEYEQGAAYPEIYCSNDQCLTTSWGIYCYMVEKVNQEQADKFLSKWYKANLIIKCKGNLELMYGFQVMEDSHA